MRELREEDPRRPSTRISADRELLSAAADKRDIEPERLVTLLRGDLDCIVMKALEKDRARRYETPLALGDDIRRFLANQPVRARAATASYRLKNTSGAIAPPRSRLPPWSSSWSRSRRCKPSNCAASRVKGIVYFMVDMFKVSDPNETRGNSLTAREILDQASQNMQNALARDPEVQSQMMEVMGSHLPEPRALPPRSQIGRIRHGHAAASVRPHPPQDPGVDGFSIAKGSTPTRRNWSVRRWAMKPELSARTIH